MSVSQGISYIIRIAAQGGKEVTAELKQVGENGEKSFKKLGGQVDMTSVRLAQMGKIISRGVLAFGALAAAAVTYGIQQMEVIDQNAKMARSFNITYDEMAAMALVAEEGGSSLERLVSAMSPLQEKLGEAANGSKTWQEEFKKLGLSVEELLGMSPAQQFAEVAEALSAMENTTRRNALAAKIFGGDVGRELIPLLDDYKIKVAEAAEFNRRFNISMSDIDAAKVEEANDAWGRVMSVMRGLGNTIAVQLAPVITAISNAFIDAGADGKSFGQAVKTGIGVAAAALDILRLGLIGFKISFMTILVGINQGVAGFVTTLDIVNKKIVDVFNKVPGVTLKANEGLSELGKSLREDWAAGVAEIEKLNDELINFESTASRINKANEEAEERARKNAGKRTAPSFGGIVIDPDAAKNATKAAKEIEKAAKEAQKGWDDMIDTIVDGLESGEFSLKSFADIAVRELQRILKAKRDAAPDTVGTGGGLGDIFGGMFSGVGGFFKGLFGFEGGGVMSGRGPLPLKTYSNGGIANSPQLAVYGEGRKPEAYVPLPDGRSIPVTMQGGGMGLNVIVNNNAGVRVRPQPVQSRGPVKELKVEIDEMNASLIRDPGSRTSAALAKKNLI